MIVHLLDTDPKTVSTRDSQRVGVRTTAFSTLLLLLSSCIGVEQFRVAQAPTPDPAWQLPIEQDLGSINASLLQYNTVTYPTTLAHPQSFSFQRMARGGGPGDERVAWIAGLASSSTEFRTFGRLYRPHTESDDLTVGGWSALGSDFAQIDDALLTPQIRGGALAMSPLGNVVSVFSGAEDPLFHQSSVYGLAQSWGMTLSGIAGATSPAVKDPYPYNVPTSVGAGAEMSVAWHPGGSAYAAWMSTGSLNQAYVNRFQPWLGWDLGPGTLLGRQVSEVSLIEDGFGVSAFFRTNFTPINRLAVGGDFTCGLNNGSVRCFGDNLSGELAQSASCTAGVGTIGSFNATPRTTSCLDQEEVIAIASGLSHTCAIVNNPSATPAITVSCWGENGNGQLGNGLVADSARPVAVAGLDFSQFIPRAISAGDAHTCLTVNNNVSGFDEVYCWGLNDHGQLGTAAVGVPASSGVPLQAVGLAPTTVLGFPQITSGAAHNCVLDGDADILCWGRNDDAQAGQNIATLDVTPAQSISFTFGGGAGVSPLEVKAGLAHSCMRVMLIAPPNTIAVYCWGDNTNGQVGNPSPVSPEIPAAAYVPAGTLELALGRNHSCALDETGIVYCWGDDTYRQLGLGAASLALASNVTPDVVQSLVSVERIASFGDHTCAIDSDQEVWCWGRNSRAQLGAGFPFGSNSSLPVQVLKPFECARGKCLRSSWSEDAAFGRPVTLAEDVESFSAAADANGNALVVFLKDNPAINSLSCSTSAPGCNTRLYAAFRSSVGTWFTSQQIDSEYTPLLTSYYQPSFTAGGVDYPKPQVAYLSDGTFVAVAPLTDVTSLVARSHFLSAKHFTIGSGWQTGSYQADTSTLAGTASNIYRTHNDLRIFPNGEGRALIATQSVVTSALNTTAAGRKYEYHLMFYDLDDHFESVARTSAVGMTACPVLDDACRVINVEGALFSTKNEAVVVFAAPPVSGLPAKSMRLFSLEFR